MHVLVTGTVQGVFFRYRTTRKALELGITGWVKNLSDGRVEAVAEGTKDQLEKMLDWWRQGPPGAYVKQIEAAWEESTGEFETFQTRY